MRGTASSTISTSACRAGKAGLGKRQARLVQGHRKDRRGGDRRGGDAQQVAGAGEPPVLRGQPERQPGQQQRRGAPGDGPERAERIGGRVGQPARQRHRGTRQHGVHPDVEGDSNQGGSRGHGGVIPHWLRRVIFGGKVRKARALPWTRKGAVAPLTPLLKEWGQGGHCPVVPKARSARGGSRAAPWPSLLADRLPPQAPRA